MDYVKPYHETKEDDEISKEKKRGAVRDAITTFADTTTAHGLPLIINGTYALARVAWGLLWLVAIGVAFFQAYSLLYEYFVFWPTTTNIELITNTNSKFPAVTLCNMNRIRRSKVVGTRFEGLVAIDGGISGGDYDYSWFFDWSSNWFNDWTSSYSSSSGTGSSGGTGASSYGGTGVGSSDGTGASSDGGTGVDSSGGTGYSSDGGTGVGSSGGTGASSDGGTGASSSGGTGLTSSVGTGASFGGNNDETDVSAAVGDASSAGTGANTGSSAGTGVSADTGSSAGIGGAVSTPDQGSVVGGMSSFVDPIASMTTNENSLVETTVDNTEGYTGDMSSVDGSLGGNSASTTNTIGTSTSTSSTSNPLTTMSYLSTVASVTDKSPAVGSGSASSAADSTGGSSNSLPDGRRRRSTNLDKRRRRSLGSSSSSSFNLFGSSNSDFDFQYYDYYNWDDVTDENDWRGFYDRSTADDFSDLVDVVNPTRDELETLGHQAENFILQCTFDKKKCNYTDFRVTQNQDYGNCFTFNHGTGNDTIRYTSKSGAKYGLHLTIWIEQPEYIGIFSPESGARVAIHDQRTMPTPGDDGITVAPGMATSIGVRQEYIERQPHPFGNCSKDSSQTDFSGDDYYDYSFGACTKYCLQNAMLRRCGCVTDLLIDSASKCSYINSTQQMCRQAVDALYEGNRLECKCPTACNETTYRLGISSSRWPSERYEEHLYSRVSQTNANAARLLQNAEQTKKNVLRLRVYFEELNYQSTIQSPKYSVEGLLGALGGLFGLYVGFSVITIAEAAVFIVKLIKIVLCIGPKCKSEVKPTA